MNDLRRWIASLSVHRTFLRAVNDQGMVGETTTPPYINFWEPVRD